MNPLNEVMTISEAARYHGVSADTIERHCKKVWLKDGSARKANGTILINRSTVMGYTPKRKKR